MFFQMYYCITSLMITLENMILHFRRKDVLHTYIVHAFGKTYRHKIKGRFCYGNYRPNRNEKTNQFIRDRACDFTMRFCC